MYIYIYTLYTLAYTHLSLYPHLGPSRGPPGALLLDPLGSSRRGPKTTTSRVLGSSDFW